MLYQDQNEPRKPAPGSDNGNSVQDGDKKGPAMLLGDEEKPGTDNKQE